VIIYLRCVIDINMFKFAFMVVFNYLWVDEITVLSAKYSTATVYYSYYIIIL